MSTHELNATENGQEYEDDDSERVNGHRYRLLKVEHEKCRQEVHELKRKLELNEAILREVQETNELLEQSFDRRVSEKEKMLLDAEEKHRVATEECENIVSSLGAELAKQTTEMEELRRQQINRRHDEIDRRTDETASISLQAENASLKDRIEQLGLLLREEQERCGRAEETVEQLRNRCDEFEQASRNIKEQLAEKNRAFEDARAELIMRRAETMSLDATAAAANTHHSCKGNSLFAEVEDRRRNVVDKMNALREKYADVKRVCKAQTAEIKMLRTERAASLRKWENDAVHTFAENDELIRKYRNRISDLEMKLKFEIRKNDDANQPNTNDAPFGYLQSLLAAKRREADELRTKIEDLSTQLLVQEETKMNIAKQLRYWRHKASFLEAQMCVAQTEPTADPAEDLAESKIRHEKLEDSARSHTRASTASEPECDSSQRPRENSNQLSHPDAPLKRENLFLVKSLEDHGVVGLSGVKERPSIELFDQKSVRNTDNNETVFSKKTLRFAENTHVEKSSESQRPTGEDKYPVVFISTDHRG